MKNMNIKSLFKNIWMNLKFHVYLKRVEISFKYKIFENI
jgi:hypothetical protein